MTDSPILTPCGAVCDDCVYFKGEKEPQCPGCNAIKGKPFWGECSTYACAAEHGVEHCGLCAEFPCDKFIETYDPAHGPASAVL